MIPKHCSRDLAGQSRGLADPHILLCERAVPGTYSNKVAVYEIGVTYFNTCAAPVLASEYVPGCLRICDATFCTTRGDAKYSKLPSIRTAPP